MLYIAIIGIVECDSTGCHDHIPQEVLLLPRGFGTQSRHQIQTKSFEEIH